MAGTKMFTYRTADTGEIITAITPVALLRPGAAPVAGRYDGYGRVAGVDVHEALARMELVESGAWSQRPYSTLPGYCPLKIVRDDTRAYEEVSGVSEQVSDGMAYLDVAAGLSALKPRALPSLKRDTHAPGV